MQPDPPTPKEPEEFKLDETSWGQRPVLPDSEPQPPAAPAEPAVTERAGPVPPLPLPGPVAASPLPPSSIPLSPAPRAGAAASIPLTAPPPAGVRPPLGLVQPPQGRVQPPQGTAPKAPGLRAPESIALDSGEGAAQQPVRDRHLPKLSQDSSPQSLSKTTSSPRHQLEAWLAIMVKGGASDLILRAGGRPSLRVDGKIGFLPGRVPGSGPLLEVLEGIMGVYRMDSWRETGSVDAALHLDGLGRFRMNAYKQMGEPAVVIRRISEDAPQIESLDLPSEDLMRLAMRKRGLILVTGIAGSGKSTTLAAVIQYMNNNVERHVVTLEDPVELLFKEALCVISQREVGTDCESFQDGLRHALRQSPDVLLIGEMRDAETVVAALDAVETGHLVLSTLHTVNAPQTVDRILSFFPAEQHGQVRMRLADNLAGVLSQRLIPRCTEGAGLIPAFELLTSTPHVRELLEEGKTGELGRVIETGTEKGLISFNQCLRRLVQDRKVELKDALAASDRPEELVLTLRGITGSSAKVQSAGPRDERGGGGGEGLRLVDGS